MIGERVALELEDRSVLYFDYSPLWGGFYVLDASASPLAVVEAGRESVRHAYKRVWDEDLKMFLPVRDDAKEFSESVILCVGLFDVHAPAHSWSHTCEVPGGAVVSARQA